MALADINWSAHLSATSGNVTPGYGACRDALGIDYVVATAANLIAAGGMLEGIFLTAGAPSGTVQIQVTGPLDRTITGLGTGAATSIGLNALGALTRGGTPAIGVCNQWGDAVIGAVAQSIAPTPTDMLVWLRSDLGITQSGGWAHRGQERHGCRYCHCLRCGRDNQRARFVDVARNHHELVRFSS